MDIKELTQRIEVLEFAITYLAAVADDECRTEKALASLSTSSPELGAAAEALARQFAAERANAQRDRERSQFPGLIG